MIKSTFEFENGREKVEFCKLLKRLESNLEEIKYYYNADVYEQLGLLKSIRKKLMEDASC